MTPDEAHSLALDAFKKGVYAKNIQYPYTKNADLSEFDFVRATCGSPGQVSWITQQSYAKCGLQIQVQKAVSDDLLASDFAPASNFDDVPWPAEVCELYFEDPLLPSILLMKCKTSVIEKRFPGLEVRLEANEYVSALIQEGTGHDSKMLSLQLKPDMYESFMSESETEAMARLSPLNKVLNPQDNATMAVLIRLVMKVFAFASIPHFRPHPIQRNEMRFGGKPDVKGRPNRPAFRCLYAPNIQYEEVGLPHRPQTPAKHDFMGRRGHFRFFKSDRFVHVKNTWTFIRPVAGPDGTFPKTIMKVRKPG